MAASAREGAGLRGPGVHPQARGQNLPLRVSAISPGVVETEFFTVRNFGDAEAGRRFTSALPCLQPRDVAQVRACAGSVRVHSLSLTCCSTCVACVPCAVMYAAPCCNACSLAPRRRWCGACLLRTTWK